ncbi:MAG: HAD hydrolase family protein [Bacteroidetes bacterium]|nr:HAD hydrolase family protein [Bacteroidota bacterium]MCL5738324.1 HAD hydrolase family protein [Bacteroidota bacterium]
MTRVQTLLPKLKKIKVILLDVDGVLTDGTIIYGSDGLELKAFDSKDGFGITNAIKSGIKVGIITARKSEVVKRRATELGIVDLYQGSLDKITPFEEIKNVYSLSESEIAYVGDDILDLPLLQKVGLSAAPANAVREVKMKVDYVTKARGGQGAVREVIDLILKAQKK